MIVMVFAGAFLSFVNILEFRLHTSSLFIHTDTDFIGVNLRVWSGDNAYLDNTNQDLSIDLSFIIITQVVVEL